MPPPLKVVTVRPMKNHHNIRLGLLGVVAIVVCTIAGVAGYSRTQRYHVGAMLNIGTLPASVSDIDCASFGITDVLERCAFRIAPADLNALLRGYRYVEAVGCRSGGPVGMPCLDEKERAQSSHSYCCGPKVGPEFPIARAFTANPEEFEHGGTIEVLTDGSGSRAMVDLYIE